MSGENDSTWLARCYKTFFENYGFAFVHYEAWDVLKNHHKWRGIKAVVPGRRVRTAEYIEKSNELFRGDTIPRPPGKPRPSKSQESDSSRSTGSSSMGGEDFKEMVQEELRIEYLLALILAWFKTKMIPLLSGPDIGGFDGNATPKLFGRWFHLLVDIHRRKPLTMSLGLSGRRIYRQRGGSIIPFGPAHQHVGEANPNDDLSLLVALDENGKAEGVMFEDDGESYEYINGVCLLTTYVAELRSSVITVSVSKTEGLWKRPNRRLHVHIPDGNCKAYSRCGKLSALPLRGIDVLVSPAEVKYGE
ncbi:heteroglycan glucosidase 1 [Tanacetum coccineum]